MLGTDPGSPGSEPQLLSPWSAGELLPCRSCAREGLESLQQGSATFIGGIPGKSWYPGETPTPTEAVGAALVPVGPAKPAGSCPSRGTAPGGAGQGRAEQSRVASSSHCPVPPSHCVFFGGAVTLLEGPQGSGKEAGPYQSCSRTTPWQACREAELYTVDGYVFQESSIRPRTRTLQGQQARQRPPPCSSLLPPTAPPTPAARPK